MSNKPPSATSSVEIAASPATVYGLITDLQAMSQIAEETAVMRWSKGSSAAPGAVFKGTNRKGWRRWTTKCTITDAAPGERFAFDVSHAGVPVARWQYDIAPMAEGCAVTESTWDVRPRWYVKPSAIATASKNRAAINADHIQSTLQRLKNRAEAAN